MPSIKLSVPKKTKCTIGSIVDFTFSLTHDDFHLASVLVIHTKSLPKVLLQFPMASFWPMRAHRSNPVQVLLCQAQGAGDEIGSLAQGRRRGDRFGAFESVYCTNLLCVSWAASTIHNTRFNRPLTQISKSSLVALYKTRRDGRAARGEGA